MATIAYDIRQRSKNNGKYYTIYWKVFNDGDTRWWSTGQSISKEYVEFREDGKKQKGMERHFKITDSGLKNSWDEQERDMCERVNRIVAGNRHMSAVAIRAQIQSEERAKNLDFLEFCQKWIDENPKQRRGIDNYKSAVNAFREFLGRDTYDVHELDSKVMFSFVKWIEKPKNKIKHPNNLERLYNYMMDEYNNYDRNIIVIPDLLQNWRRAKKNIDIPKKDITDIDISERRLSADDIRKIANAHFEEFELECQKKMVEAREVFLLSFCLMGINLRDLWVMPASCFHNGVIKYNRAKTGVHTEVIVPKQIKAIFEKYRDKKGKYLFDFCYRSKFKENTCYRQRINKGLKQLSNKLGIKEFTFYATRSTISTIVLEQGFGGDDIADKMLQHTTGHKVLHSHYAPVLYADINTANEKLMQFLFGDEEIKTFNY